MSKYTIGRRYEYKAKKLLEQEGWQVTRAAGSHGAWDLVAFKEGEKVRCIQVKQRKAERGMKHLFRTFKSQSTSSYTHELCVWHKGQWWWTIFDNYKRE